MPACYSSSYSCWFETSISCRQRCSSGWCRGRGAAIFARASGCVLAPGRSARVRMHAGAAWDRSFTVRHDMHAPVAWPGHVWHPLGVEDDGGALASSSARMPWACVSCRASGGGVVVVWWWWCGGGVVVVWWGRGGEGGAVGPRSDHTRTIPFFHGPSIARTAGAYEQMWVWGRGAGTREQGEKAGSCEWPPSSRQRRWRVVAAAVTALARVSP